MEIDDLVVTSDLQQLPRVIEYVRQACSVAGLNEDDCFACELATDEACTNIMEHAYQGRSNGRILVSCWWTQHRFFIRFHDHGVAFDPDLVKAPLLEGDLSQREIGGLGLHFMRSLMDEIHFEFDEVTGNTLTMARYLRPK